MSKTREKIAEIDLMAILKELVRKAWIIILCAVIFASAAFAWTYYMVKPTYEANVKMYVNNASISVGSVGVSISSSDINCLPVFW